MRRHQILLLTTLLFSLVLLQNTSADDRRNPSSTLYEDRFASALQTPSKSKAPADQLLLLSPAETPPKIAKKPPRPPAQDSSSWSGKLKSKAKDGLNSAKEAVKAHIPESVTEHARGFKDKAKRFSETVTNQAEKVAHKAEEIYDGVSSKLTQEKIKKPNEPEIKLAADFIDLDGDSDIIPIKDEVPKDENKGIFGAFRQKISDVSNSVKNKMKYASISQSVSNKFKSIKEKTASLIHAPSNLDLKETFSNLGKHIQGIPQKISQKYTEITQSSDSATEETPSWFSQSFDKAKQKLKHIIPSTTPLKEKISFAYQQVKDKGFSSVSNFFTGAKDRISRFAGTAKGRFSENFDKITEKVKQAVPATIPLKEKITSAYHQVKDRTLPSVSNLFKGAKDNISRFGSSAKGKLSETFDYLSPKFLAPVYGVMRFGSWMWNLMAWRKFIYWFVGIVIGCLLLKVLLFLLPFIQMTVSVLKTPFQVLFMINSLIRQFYPAAKADNGGAQRQRAEPEIKKKVQVPKEKDRSYHRYSSSQEEWQRAGHHELNEPKRPGDLDSDQIRRRFEDVQENEDRYYNYYRCYGCNHQWENVTVGKGPVQECRNENCKYAFGPYHEIPLLNNKQKKEEFQKVKTE